MTDLTHVTRTRCPGCGHLYSPPDLDAFTPTPNGRASEAEHHCPYCDQALIFRLTTHIPTDDQEIA